VNELVAFASRAPLTGDIGAALIAAGFDQEFSGEHIPPVTEYTLRGAEQGFFAEFLTPLSGDGLKRDGRSDVTVKKAGITAQKLRYLDLLLISPWSIQVSSALGIPVQPAVAVNVPNPVSFLAQKLLIVRLRQEQFSTITDVHRNAARIPQDRALTPQRLQAACAYGLDEIFGP
jgi:hypothetical protein